MAVGRANGNIEIYEWAVAEHAQAHTLQAPQAWVLSKVSIISFKFTTHVSYLVLELI